MGPGGLPRRLGPRVAPPHPTGDSRAQPPVGHGRFGRRRIRPPIPAVPGRVGGGTRTRVPPGGARVSLARPYTAEEPATRPGATRAAIVAELATVPGLTATTAAPDQATAGAAWPRWIQTTYDGHLCTLARDQYDVLVTLPADYLATTVDQGDGFRDTVALVLVRLGRVAYAEPVSIAFQDRQT